MIRARKERLEQAQAQLPAVTGQLLAAPSSVPAPCEQSTLPFWEQIPIYKGALLVLTPCC